MSKFDGKLDAAGAALINSAELLAALQGPASRTEKERQEALARCLSAGEGWKEAMRLAGGAFAPGLARGRVKDD